MHHLEMNICIMWHRPHSRLVICALALRIVNYSTEWTLSCAVRIYKWCYRNCLKITLLIWLKLSTNPHIHFSFNQFGWEKCGQYWQVSIEWLLPQIVHICGVRLNCLTWSNGNWSFFVNLTNGNHYWAFQFWLVTINRIFMNYTDTLNVCSLLLILFSWLDNWIYRFKSLLATYHTFSHSLRQPRSVSFSPAPWLRARMLSIGLFPFNFPSAFSLSKNSFNR